jgi:hypothetical protein
MQLNLDYDIPFVNVVLTYKGVSIEVSNVLVDTGSARSIFAADIVSSLEIYYEPEDVIETMRGVGGIETIFERLIDSIQVDTYKLDSFPVQIGGMDYGFDIYGTLGMDFLVASQAILNFGTFTMSFNQS